MGTNCECNDMDLQKNNETHPTKFSHLETSLFESIIQNSIINIIDLHKRCETQNSTYDFEQFYQNRSLESPFIGKLCNKLHKEFNLHNLINASKCKPCGKHYYFDSKNRNDSIECECPFVNFGNKKYGLLHGDFCEKEIGEDDFRELCVKGNICGGFNCTGFDVRKLTETGDLTEKINKLTGCVDCPYFINKDKETPQKLFSDKFCNRSNEQKICNEFCIEKKTKSCSIKTYSYKNSTDEDVTCKCNENYEVDPKTRKCREQKKTCGITEDFTWETNYSDSCNCPLIAGTNVTASTTVRATYGENCDKKKKNIENLCTKSCNIERGNRCDLIPNPNNKNRKPEERDYILKCTCKKPTSRITNKKVSLFNNVRCSKRTFDLNFCIDHCPWKKGKWIKSCTLKKGVKVDDWIDKGDFDCKYHDKKSRKSQPSKKITTIEVTPKQDVEKEVSAEMTKKPFDSSCWNPLEILYYEKGWFNPPNAKDNSNPILFTKQFCKDHSCDSGKCCFKSEFKNKYSLTEGVGYKYIEFEKSDILCK